MQAGSIRSRPSDGEPMKRHTPPQIQPRPAEDCRVLEALLRQNQILLELLGAMNGLTAALLARERRGRE